MPTASQWEYAVERHRRRRQAALSCCVECRALGKEVYADPEDEELWALLGRPGGDLVDVFPDDDS